MGIWERLKQNDGNEGLKLDSPAADEVSGDVSGVSSVWLGIVRTVKKWAVALVSAIVVLVGAFAKVILLCWLQFLPLLFWFLMRIIWH
ncbi:MAG: hypothetical protein R3E95_23055 [Thiolinea sp.]